MNESLNKKNVAVYDINLVGKPLVILNTPRNNRQLDTANSIIVRIAGLVKEYNGFIERLEK